MDKREQVARALDPEAFGPCPAHWMAIQPKGTGRDVLDAQWRERSSWRRKQAFARADAAIAALEPAPVSVHEAARVLELAMQRAQIPWEILRRFQNGEPIAALRALAEKGEA